MKVLLQLQGQVGVEGSGTRKRIPTKKKRAGVAPQVSDPAEQIEQIRREWRHNVWTDIGVHEAPTDDIDNVDWLQNVPGLKMGDRVRCIPILDEDELVEADILPAISVVRVTAAPPPPEPPRDENIFDDIDEDEEEPEDEDY